MNREIESIETLALDCDGCFLIKNLIGKASVNEITTQIENVLETNLASPVRYRSKTFGARNLAATWDGWLAITQLDVIRDLLTAAVGKDFGLVRILYFDKPPGDGWSLPWHRDLTIAVKEHIQPLTPFSKPTVKAGIPHVEATTDILSQMLTVRLSLDPMVPENGPLLFIPGSHLDSDGSSESTNLSKEAGLELACEAGDAFVMRPRIIHASRNSAANSEIHRRVLHMEFAPESAMPAPWQWNSFLRS